MKYFAYGSNMDTAHLRESVPSCQPMKIARLKGYQLRFHKRSTRDGTAKCDAFRTDYEGDAVWGVVFEIDPRDKDALDRKEGTKGGHYREVEVVVVLDSSDEIKALTYLAGKEFIVEALPVDDGYRAHVLNGAKEHGLPVQYIQAYIEVLQTIGRRQS